MLLNITMRFCHAHCHDYDVVVSTDAEIDFGRLGVQYTHYPPVLWSGAIRDWAERKPAFVGLDGLSPDKRLMELIGIIERVRERGFAVELEGIREVVADFASKPGNA